MAGKDGRPEEALADKVFQTGLLRDERICGSREKAMKALEEERRYLQSEKREPGSLHPDGLRMVRLGLNACMRCDYSSPGIAEVIDECLGKGKEGS